jgi:uncharacterized DUF497 family protein
MDFEWHEKKRLSNLEKHGLDFLDIGELFSGPCLEAETKEVKGEKRWFVTGIIDDLVVTAVITKRGDVIRVISLRRARRGERTKFDQIFERPT